MVTYLLKIKRLMLKVAPATIPRKGILALEQQIRDKTEKPRTKITKAASI